MLVLEMDLSALQVFQIYLYYSFVFGPFNIKVPVPKSLWKLEPMTVNYNLKCVL